MLSHVKGTDSVDVIDGCCSGEACFQLCSIQNQFLI